MTLTIYETLDDDLIVPARAEGDDGELGDGLLKVERDTAEWRAWRRAVERGDVELRELDV
jgi:hypothetical protein